MKKSAYTILTLIMAFACLLAAQVTVHAAAITDGYPGYPNQWEDLTTNTIIEITLDAPVALTGNPPAPDWDYCVTKASFSGLDFVLTDVSCEVEVSADRKTIKLYPNDVLDGSSLYAYKVININFDGGGSEQDVSAYFETGTNPIPVFATQVDEADMCGDNTFPEKTMGQVQPFCGRCHVDWIERFPAFFPCIMLP
jgi:hypothetical protein